MDVQRLKDDAETAYDVAIVDVQAALRKAQVQAMVVHVHLGHLGEPSRADAMRMIAETMAELSRQVDELYDGRREARIARAADFDGPGT